MGAEVFDDRFCALGEGPLWHPVRQSLFWFDIDNKVMYEKAIGGARREYHFDRTVTAAGLLADPGRLFVASERDLFVYGLETGTEDILCPLDAENPVTRSNDGRADPYGGFWIGTMGYKAEPQQGAIYRYYKGEVRKLFDQITVSNAICFAPDKSVAYYTDSRTKLIKRVALDGDGWPASAPEDFLDFRSQHFGPDGAVCDTHGNLWSAQWMGARVAVFAPDGTPGDVHLFPTSLTTCPAFGGPDLRDLFVTTAGAHLPHPLKGTQAEAGFVFRVQNAGQGREEYRVQI